jgi:hypothetical protein
VRRVINFESFDIERAYVEVRPHSKYFLGQFINKRFFDFSEGLRELIIAKRPKDT